MPEPTAADLLWAAPRTPKRGPRPRVRLDEIVATAVRLADAEGIAAASMQRVADELGVTKMALYRYVPGRAELVALMVDAAMGPAPEPAGDDWRAGLERWARAMRDVFTAHRWLLATAVGPRVFGPNELGWTESGLAALAELPLTAAERLDTLALVGAQQRGLLQQQTEGEVEARLGAMLAEVLAANAADYPLAAAAFGDAAADGEHDHADDYGLARILDGIAALAAARR